MPENVPLGYGFRVASVGQALSRGFGAKVGGRFLASGGGVVYGAWDVYGAEHVFLVLIAGAVSPKGVDHGPLSIGFYVAIGRWGASTVFPTRHSVLRGRSSQAVRPLVLIRGVGCRATTGGDPDARRLATQASANGGASAHGVPSASATYAVSGASASDCANATRRTRTSAGRNPIVSIAGHGPDPHASHA